MSDVGVHSFQIPHEHVQPTRDMVIVRIPLPPSKIGSILTPDVTRDMMQHNVMAGRVVRMGPLAFNYKDGWRGWWEWLWRGTVKKQDVQIGDWVLFRPFAGTMIQGGKLTVTNGWRYMSSFNDVIGIIKSKHMPHHSLLEWEASNVHAETPTSDFDFSNSRAAAHAEASAAPHYEWIKE